MAARTHSSDPRAKRVRTLLRDAAFALAHERPVDEITVGDLVARAGVSRQVFYQHFSDRDDAVSTAFAVAFSAAVADSEANVEANVEGDAIARITRLFEFAAEHRAMYRNVVPSAVTQPVVAAFRAELLPACEEIAAQGMTVVGAIADIPPESVSRFLVGGFQEVLRSWMEDAPSANEQATDLRRRVAAALDTVDALLGLSADAGR